MKSKQKADWHSAMIVARLRMNETSLRQLARDNGYYPTALSIALQRSWPKAEGIIAAAIGVKPQEIWPTRYAKRAAKKAKRTGALNALDSIKNCSHDCNVHAAGRA